MVQTFLASATLIVAACISLAYAAKVLLGPGRYTLWERLLYAPVYVLARVLWRVELIWLEDQALGRIDRNRLLDDRLRGGAILVANHRCSLDPFFIQLIGGRRLHWMVASEYFGVPFIGPLLKSYEAIPTKRAGVDTAATKRAIALARSGRYVGMFPEGRINRTQSPILTIRPGAAIVAQRAGVPLIPVWIEGAPQGPEVYSALFIPAKVRVYVGFPDRSGLSTSIENAPALNVEGLDAESVASEPNDIEAGGNGFRSDREKALQWVARVMAQALEFGGHSKDSVQFAGKNWLTEV